MPTIPHKLDLYRLAVQHPQAEAAFLARVYAHYNRGRAATLLKEDFAGGAALAMAWVGLSDDHQCDGRGPPRAARLRFGLAAGDESPGASRVPTCTCCAQEP